MEINIDSEVTRFSDFISEKDNKNIVFSGIFGIGKTYFLKKFFDKNERFNAVHLSPVNYSVSKSEDIFEYIKIDILFGLLYKDIDFEKVKCSFTLGVQMYLMNNYSNFIESILTTAEKVKFNTNILEKIFKFKTTIEDYCKTISIDDREDGIKFIKDFANKRGTIYEDNAITQLIRSYVEYLKENGKETVLIIDDLDRIDPEHIFRILNILSAHDNFYDTNEHKFGFDKIIIVCDIENIRNIYSSKYGINVDFNGYIDKFYSKEVYHFDNTSNILREISQILKSTTSSQIELGLNNDSFYSYIVSEVILHELIRNKSINIRTLLKIINKDVKINKQIILKNKKIFVSDYICLIIFGFIKSIFSTTNDFVSAISKITDFKINNQRSYNEISLDIVSNFIILADYENNQFINGDYSCNKFYRTIEYSVLYNNYGIAKLNINEMTNVNLENLIKDACKNYIRYFTSDNPEN